MKLVTVKEMQAIEREADANGLTYQEMMENAGTNLARTVNDRYSSLRQGGVLGLVGSGNNGGDTLVALAWLADQGWPVSAYLARPRPTDDPYVKRVLQMKGAVYSFENDLNLHQLQELVANHIVLLDGILGTGFQIPLKKEVAKILEFVGQEIKKHQPLPVVVAVDCPSGVNCDTGEAAQECLPADLTVSMAAIKQGLLLFPAYRLVGEIQVVDIGLSDPGIDLDAWRNIKRLVPEAQQIRQALPVRPLDAHKGTFGTALVIAGSVNYTGAALLAGQAAYRVGAGLVTLGVPTPLHAALAGHFPEATWLLLPHETGVISRDAANLVHKNLSKVTALLLGPGFGLEDTTADFLTRLLEPASRTAKVGIGFVKSQNDQPISQPGSLPPLVVDADGLKLLTRIPSWARRLPDSSVLTPHPGEMSILTGLPTSEIQADRLRIAERFSQEWGHVVVLKGAMTVVSAPDGRTAIIPVATPALARAGTGDVLAGMIVGLRAQGMEAFSAAMVGAWLHGQAGLRAATQLGNAACVIAGDVLRASITILSEMSDQRSN